MEGAHQQHHQDRGRVTLRCSVTIAESGRGRKVQTVTENLGSDGFYCILSESPQMGESFETEIALSTGSPWGVKSAKLLCLAHVNRIDVRGPHRFGVDFSIDEYTIAMASG